MLFLFLCLVKGTHSFLVSPSLGKCPTSVKLYSLTENGSPNAKQLEYLRKQGYQYDEERGVYTKKPAGAKSRRRPAIVRSGERILEARFDDTASEITVTAGRQAAERLREVLQKSKTMAKTEESVRSELEVFGRAFASNAFYGPFFLLALQISSWTIIRSVLIDQALMSTTVSDPVTASIFAVSCSIVFIAGTRNFGIFHDSITNNELEKFAADAVAGAYAFPAPRHWRSTDLVWISVHAFLELAAAIPRLLLVHVATQAPLDQYLDAVFVFYQYSIDDATAMAAVAATIAVATFAAVSEFVAVVSDSHTQNTTPNSRFYGLAEELQFLSKDLENHKPQPNDQPKDALYRSLVAAWIEYFSPALSLAYTENKYKLIYIPAAAFVRTAAAATAFRLAGDDLSAPFALHALAALLAILTSFSKKDSCQDNDDPDRVVVVLD